MMSRKSFTPMSHRGGHSRERESDHRYINRRPVFRPRMAHRALLEEPDKDRQSYHCYHFHRRDVRGE